MGMLREWLNRAVGVFQRSRLDRQTEEEMRFHLEMEVERAMLNGLPRDEAERQARLHAGAITTAMEEVRDQRGLGWLDGTAMDFRHAWNALRRQPGFLFAAAGALTAAVSINTLIFTMVNGVILRPLPYPTPDRLVRVFEYTPRNPKFAVSIYNYLEDKRANRTLDGIALYFRDDLQLMHGDRAERLTTVRITDDFLPTLGVSPALGRNFTVAELRQSARVVMLSDAIWKSRFQSDPAIVGKTIRLNRENWTVVGVLPAGFQHVGGSYRSPLQGDTVALWAPIGLDLQVENGLRFWHFTNAVARLKPGIPMKAAEEDLNRIMDDLKRRYPDAYARARARVEPLAAEVVGRSSVTVRIVVAAGVLVLLVACINIAGLSLARVLSRRRELAIRQALGGGSWRLIRAVLSENLMIGLIGGTLGAALAAALVPLLRLVLPADFPRLHEIGFSFAALAFAFAAAILTSAIAGLIPALRQLGSDPRDGLTEENRVTAGIHRVTSLRGALVAAEIALSCVLCFGAVLLVRSGHLLGERDHGFDPAHVLTFRVELPSAAYSDAPQLAAFCQNAVDRWRSLPGVKAAGLTTNVPWTGYDENTSFDIPGRPVRPGESIQARFQAGDPGMLPALHMRLLRGRWIEPTDHADAAKVVVVNDALARRFFDGNPVGRIVDIWDAKRQIVGVVSDLRDRPADSAAEPAFWFPLAQQPFPNVTAVLRTAGDPLGVTSAARAALDSLDRELPISDVRTMETITSEALAERHFALWLCEAFAALAMALAAVGVYGLLTYVVEQRRREIGIRLALGASRGGVVWTILSNGLFLAGVGTVAGLALAPLAGRMISSLLFGVTAGDPSTLAAAPSLILLIAFLGALAPGWIASRTEPMSALREQ